MIRSLAFTTAGKLHTKDANTFLMPTMLADTNLFLWVDLESPTPDEWKEVLEKIFHFHPLSIEDCVQPSPSPKVESLGENLSFPPAVDRGLCAAQPLAQGGGVYAEGRRLVHAVPVHGHPRGGF
jgi:hypothetical protein